MHLFSPRHSSNTFGSALGYRKRSSECTFSRLSIARTSSALLSAIENVRFNSYSTLFIFNMTTIEVELKRLSVSGLVGNICYRVEHDGEQAEIMTNYKLYSSEWDDESRQIIIPEGNCSVRLVDLRLRIIADKDNLQNTIRQFENSGCRYSVSDVVEEYKKLSRSYSVFKFMEELIVSFEASNRLGTARNYKAAYNSFRAFARQDLLLTEITESLVQEYDAWLRQKKVTRNTISFYMRILRSVFNKAVSCDLAVQCKPFGAVYTGVDKTGKRSVSEEVIRRLHSLDLSKHISLIFARDLFLFSFYMRGISFVDLAYLKKSNVQDGVIRYTRRKTGSRMNIRLEPCMKEIIARYALQTEDTPFIFPIIFSTNDKRSYEQYRNALSYYNKSLKQLSSLLNLVNPLTSYVARHTWATMARDKNIPISVISAGMGHRSEQITRIYLDSLDTSIIDEANLKIISEFKLAY